MMTRCNIEISDRLYANKLHSLINQFYKILPIRETEPDTLAKYLASLQREMLGAQALIEALGNDARYLTLLAILQYMIDHNGSEEYTQPIIKSDVFRAINILKIMQQGFSTHGGEKK